MSRSLYVAPWLESLEEWIHAIELALSCKFGVANQRAPLTRDRDALHQLLQRFEADGEAENDEEVYLALFDALSFLGTALNQHPMNRGYLVESLELLRQVRSVLDHRCALQR